MAKTTASVTILAATSGAAGSTKASPGANSGWIDVRAYYGGQLGYSIKNDGSGAPGVAGAIQFQSSPDNGTTVFDLQAVGGDTVAYNAGTLAGLTTGSITLEKIMYLRALCYGNTTNTVTYAVNLQAVTAL